MNRHFKFYRAVRGPWQDRPAAAPEASPSSGSTGAAAAAPSPPTAEGAGQQTAGAEQPQVARPSSVLHVVPFHLSTGAHLAQRLCPVLERVYGLYADVRPPGFDPEVAFDAMRGQYNSRVLLSRLLESTEAGQPRVLGVTGVDLFIPVLTYVFGEAQLGGRAAVVSVHRLRPETYGLPQNDPLLEERLRKEAIHELGHNFGLVHCPNARCVMHASTYAEEIDLKGDGLCRACRAECVTGH